MVDTKVQSVSGSSCVPFLMSVRVLSEYSESKDLIGGSTGESIWEGQLVDLFRGPFGRSNGGQMYVAPVQGGP